MKKEKTKDTAVSKASKGYMSALDGLNTLTRDKLVNYVLDKYNTHYGLGSDPVGIDHPVKVGEPVQAKPEDSPFGWMAQVNFTNDLEPMKTISLKEYDELVANQKPNDWKEDTILINIETLTEVLTEKLSSVLPNVTDKTIIYDELYDLIYKNRV